MTVQQSTQQQMNIKYADYLYIHDYIITLHNYNSCNYYNTSPPLLVKFYYFGDQGLLGLGTLEDLHCGIGSLDCSALALAGFGLFVTGGELLSLLVTGEESGIVHAANHIFSSFTCWCHIVSGPSIKTLCMTLPKFSLIIPGTHLSSTKISYPYYIGHQS